MSDLHEIQRLRALREMNLLDTLPSESFDRITRVASQLFRTPISAVSLTDQHRQWFKSQVGCSGTEIPREFAPCAEVTRTRQALVVPDITVDSRFAGSVLVGMGIRFYAGAPLTTRDQYCLGSMCVLDNKVRGLDVDNTKVLKDLAAMVMTQVELQHAFGRIDPQSGLPNQNQYIDDLEDLARDKPLARRMAVLIDLADGEHLNEALRVLGTSYAEDLVKGSKSLIHAVLGNETGLYHVGATQFVFLAGDQDDRDLHAQVAKLQVAFKKPLSSHQIPITTSVAIGMAPFLPGETHPQDILRMAHSAAQDAREAEITVGRYSKSSDDIHRRCFRLLDGMRTAMDATDQLRLVYQPRVDLRTGRMLGVEALLRWTHPTLGPVSPGEFVPLVERTALIRPLTDWVMDATLRQGRIWQDQGTPIRISVNVSAANFEEEGFADRLIDTIERHGVQPRRIELEFTESALIRNRARVVSDLALLRARGVSCAIDDFGNGYSSFSYLCDIPADAVKIDQSFIRGLNGNPRNRKLVGAMISMAHDLGYIVVAEGIETQDVYDLLAQMGCDEGQGYLMSKPIAAFQLEDWLRSENPRRAAATPVAA